MKRFIGIFMTALFVIGLAASAYATTEIDFGGDARVRGIWKNNYNFDDDVDADSRYWDTRVRLTAVIKAGNGVAVKARMKLVDAKFDGAANTTGSVMTDYAYLVVPVGGFTISAGLQMANWGNKFLVWQASKDRIKITTKAGGTTFGVLHDKANEVLAGDNDGDTDGYAALAIQNFGDVKAGVIVIFVTNDTSGDDGVIADVFFSGTAGGLGVAGELAYKGGDLFEGADGDAGMGGFVQVSSSMDALTVAGALAYATNGYTANKYFTPTLFFGKSQPTAIMDFGAGDDETTWAVVGVVAFKASDMISVSGKVAYADFEVGSVIEVDGGIKFNITKNTSWQVDVGYLMPDDMSAADDAAIALAHKLQINFP